MRCNMYTYLQIINWISHLWLTCAWWTVSMIYIICMIFFINKKKSSNKAPIHHLRNIIFYPTPFLWSYKPRFLRCMWVCVLGCLLMMSNYDFFTFIFMNRLEIAIVFHRFTICMKQHRQNHVSVCVASYI